MTVDSSSVCFLVFPSFLKNLICTKQPVVPQEENGHAPVCWGLQKEGHLSSPALGHGWSHPESLKEESSRPMELLNRSELCKRKEGGIISLCRKGMWHISPNKEHGFKLLLTTPETLETARERKRKLVWHAIWLFLLPNFVNSSISSYFLFPEIIPLLGKNTLYLL